VFTKVEGSDGQKGPEMRRKARRTLTMSGRGEDEVVDGRDQAWKTMSKTGVPRKDPQLCLA